jgi:hypothetical protein
LERKVGASIFMSDYVNSAFIGILKIEFGGIDYLK